MLQENKNNEQVNNSGVVKCVFWIRKEIHLINIFSVGEIFGITLL